MAGSVQGEYPGEGHRGPDAPPSIGETAPAGATATPATTSTLSTDPQIVAMLAVLQTQSQQIAHLLQEMGKQKGHDSHKGHTPALTQIRGIDRVGKFDGSQPENFETWKERLISHTSSVLGMVGFLKWGMAQRWEDLDVEKIADYDCNIAEPGFDAPAMSNQLYSLLLDFTTDDALNIVTNAGNGERNGIRAWSKLGAWYNFVTSQGRRKLLSKIIQPLRVHKLTEVLKATEDWDKLHNKYMESAQKPLPNDILVVAYMALLPPEICKNINALNHDFDDLQELRSYVRRQVLSGQHEEPPRSGKGAAAYQVAWEESWPHEYSDACQHAEGDGHEAAFSLAKSKGKGLSGGQWQNAGYIPGKGPICNFCGEAGHIKSKCQKFTDHLNQKRANGDFGTAGGPKGGGKGAWGNGTQPKGGWHTQPGQNMYNGKGAAKGGQYTGKGGQFPGGKAMAYLFDAISGEEVAPNNFNSVQHGLAPASANYIQAYHVANSKPVQRSPTNIKVKTTPKGQHIKFQNSFWPLAADDEEEEPEEVEGVHGDFPTPQAAAWELKTITHQKFQSPRPTFSNSGRNKTKKQNKLVAANLVTFAPAVANASPMVIHQVEPFASSAEGWTKVTTDMDSGCVTSVAPPGLLPQIPITESEGSKVGQQYVVANGETVPNLGEKIVNMTDCAGQENRHVYQIAEVTSPLTSVGDIADQGNLVVFGKRGGFVWNVLTNRATPFPRINKRYKWEFWVPQHEQPAPASSGAAVAEVQQRPENDSGFTRPGRA